MSRLRKIALIVAASMTALTVLGVIAGVIIVQTGWFRNMVRTKVVSAVEEATGGRTEIGSFTFDWHRLRAEVRDFVIHGLEPPTAAPLLRVKQVTLELKILSPLRGFVDLAYLSVDTPQANIIVFPDGRTNIPAPKLEHHSDKTGLETIVDLAVKHFDLHNASASFGDQKKALSITGENLRAQLGYNALTTSYTGQVATSPLFFRAGGDAPLRVEVKLPVSLEKDRVTLTNAEFVTAGSKVVISGQIEHLVAPRASAHINAQVALEEVRQAAGLKIALDTTHAPRTVTADITASTDDQNRIIVQNARVNLGQSNLEASGTAGKVQFQSSLSLGELGRLLRLAEQPEGTVHAGGNLALGNDNTYRVTGNVDGRNVSLRQGGKRFTGISLDSSVTADSHRIDLGGLRLNVLGGGFSGSAAIEEMARFHVSGDLHNFDLDHVANVFMAQRLGYDGVVSGKVTAEGNLQATSGLVATAALAIAPGRRGIPVSGRLNVDYNGVGDTVAIAPSYLALPNSRIDLSGSLGKQIQARIVSRNLNDFKPVADLPVSLNGGTASVNANITGKLSAPRITAQAAVTNFSVDGRPFTRFSADVAASQNGASLTNAVLARDALQARFSGTVGLRNWKPEPAQPLRVDATIRNGDLRDVLALAGGSTVEATGSLTAVAHISGTVGSPRGNADLTVAKGTLQGESFDSLTAHAVMAERSIDIPTLQFIAGASHIDANASYQHAVNDLQRGQLRAHVASNQVQLAQFQALVKDRPGLGGILTLTADATANVQPGASGADVQLTSLNANLAARGLEMEGKGMGDFTATASSSGSDLQYNVNSNFAGSTIHVTGQSLLTGDHRTTATASIANLPIDRVLAVAGRRDLPVNGTLGVNGQFSGTLQDPRANLTVNVVKGAAYQEPFDRLQATIVYGAQAVDLSNFRVESGPSYVELNGNFTHPANNLAEGQVRFQVRSNNLELARFHAVQQAEPGLGGIVQLAADGAATLRKNAAPLFSSLNANMAAKGLNIKQKALGDLTATAQTQGSQVAFNLVSDLGHSNIRGNGHVELGGDYPITAQMNFADVTYAGLRPLLGGEAQPFDASVAGKLTVSGPLERTEDLQGTLEISKLEAHSVTSPTGAKPRQTFELHNAAPMVASLRNSVATIQNARITGPFTELSLSGTAALTGNKAMNVRADGNIKLEVLQAFDTDIFSEGAVVLNAAVTGTTDKPLVNGRLQLQNASFHMLDLPNGITNGNGTVQFNGTQAVIQNLTGESGGGKITVTGFANYGGPDMQFRVQASAAGVHVEASSSVTLATSARLTLVGSTSRSLLSGTVTIEDVSLHSHSDIGSILASAATPPPSSSAGTGILAGIRLDVRIQTATDVQFHTALTEHLQADANLTLRGSIDHPGILGRVVVTSGDVVFFGTKYRIDQGTISFFNPQKIDPIVSLNLGTSVQGIDVSISVSGHMDRLKLAYRSDPPMLFSDLVSLLASGKVSTTDPVLAARQPPAVSQNFEQMGASTLLGQAVANPVSGRLERLFGVSKLKIDPQILGNSSTPQATLTLQQQISREITFTYIQDVTQSNPQIIRIEWAVSPQFSAVAQRDVNGIFDLDFFYKKRFK